MELDLLIVMRYRVVQGGDAAWLVQVSGYHFELQHRNGRELTAYHWHPQGAGPVTWPHLHLGPAAGDLSRPESRAHFPTGLVDVDDVVRLAIREFRAAPRRADWEALLRRTRAMRDVPDAH